MCSNWINNLSFSEIKIKKEVSLVLGFYVWYRWGSGCYYEKCLTNTNQKLFHMQALFTIVGLNSRFSLTEFNSFETGGFFCFITCTTFKNTSYSFFPRTQHFSDASPTRSVWTVTTTQPLADLSRASNQFVFFGFQLLFLTSVRREHKTAVGACFRICILLWRYMFLKIFQ